MSLKRYSGHRERIPGPSVVCILEFICPTPRGDPDIRGRAVRRALADAAARCAESETCWGAAGSGAGAGGAGVGGVERGEIIPPIIRFSFDQVIEPLWVRALYS